LTLFDIIKIIPEHQRQQLEDDFNHLFEEGYGELTFIVFKGELDTWRVSVSRKVKSS